MTDQHKESIQKWEVIVKERLDSGMTIRAFCETHGYSPGRYHYWVNIIHKEDPDFDTTGVLIRTQPEDRLSFVEISSACSDTGGSVVNTQVPVAAIQPGSARIELYPNADAVFLRNLLDGLRYVQA